MDNKRLCSVIHTRVSPKDLKKIQTDAKRLGLSNSEFIRLLTQLPIEVKQNAAGGEHQIIIYNKDLYIEFLRQIRAQGYHLDHCLHALNTIASKKFMYPEDAAEMFGQALVAIEDAKAARKSIEEKMAFIEQSDRALAYPKVRKSDIKAARKSAAHKLK